MSPLSSDPDARGRQLANLEPGAGAAEPGNGRRLDHAQRSASPLRHLDSRVVEDWRAAILEAMAEGGGGPIRRGDELEADVLAVMGAQVMHAAALYGKSPERLRLPALQAWSQITERLRRGLRAALGGRPVPEGSSLAEMLARLDDEPEDADVVDGDA